VLAPTWPAIYATPLTAITLPRHASSFYIPRPPHRQGPHTAIFDSSGQLFFTDAGPFGETSLAAPGGSTFVVTGEAHSRILRPLALGCLACPTGIALSPSESAVYVAEMAANRILRFVQRPQGVYHMTVFHQFSGRLGPSAIVCDHSRGGLLYVARSELPELAERGVVSVLSPEGALLREIEVGAGPELTGLALAPDASALYVTEASTNSVHKVLL
jgi:sugar lactone lactonase YvrE